MNNKKLTAEQIEMLEALAALPDEDIDTSDIPEASPENMRLARRGAFYRPIKKPVTIRLDADVIEWFKAHADSSGYQTAINRILRQHVVAQEKAKKAS
jgi:uncharacterized protein (DUF4415 family)